MESVKSEPAHDYAIEALKSRIHSLELNADYVIKSAEEAQAVTAQMRDIHKLIKDIEEAREAAVRPLRLAVDEERERWKPVEALATSLKAAAQRVLAAFQVAEQKRIALERAEAESRARREQAAAEEKARKEREAAEQKAAALRAAGKEERAAAVEQAAEVRASAIETAAQVTVPVLPAQTKLVGARVVEKWVPWVSDIRQALAALAADESLDLDELVSFKTAGLNKLAGVYKGRLGDKFPGLAAILDTKVSSTGR
jgi:hypothetical protein